MGISHLALIFRIFSDQNILENEFSDICTSTDFGNQPAGRLCVYRVPVSEKKYQIRVETVPKMADNRDKFSVVDLNQICKERCSATLLQCIAQCSINDTNCYSQCIREETDCINCK